MHGRYEKGHRIRDGPETPQEYLRYDCVADTGQGVDPIDFAPKYGITSDMPHTLNGSASVLKRTKYGSAPSGSVGSSDASTPATGDHGGCMAGRKLATHHFRQIHAASRRIGVLRRDIQNAHTRHLSFKFESSYRDAKGSCASRPRIAQASPRKAESPKVRKDLSARMRHARYD